MAYKLSTHFTATDLERLYRTRTKIVVAKPNDTTGGRPNVAWVAYNPLLRNDMTWEERYGIYASTAGVVNGALLEQMSQAGFPASEGMTYELLPNGSFSPPTRGGTQRSFTALNKYNNLPFPGKENDPTRPGFLTLGLYQQAIVNGASVGQAVSAAEVLYKSTAVMTPYTTVYIWTQSRVESNTVVTNVNSPMTEVTFGDSTSQVSLQYNPDSGLFVPQGASARFDESAGRLEVEGGEELAEGVKLDYILPALAA